MLHPDDRAGEGQSEDLEERISRLHLDPDLGIGHILAVKRYGEKPTVI